MNPIYLLFFIALFTSGCVNSVDETNKDHNAATHKIESWNPPPAGTVIDEYKEAIPEDKLNNAFFRVAVIATETSNNGHFDLELEYGANINETTVDLPKLKRGIILKPLLKKGTAKYECLLGFDGGDGVFKEYYLISVDKKNIKLKKTHYYYSSK